MRKKYIAIPMAVAITLSGCTFQNMDINTDITGNTANSEESEGLDSESDDNKTEDSDTQEDQKKDSSESSSYDTSSDDQEEALDEETLDEDDDFSLYYKDTTSEDDRWLDVTFEPDKSYEEVNDPNPDYSGFYADNWGTSIPYCYCNLIKQLDGTYYCEVYEYRIILDEGTATYVEDGLLDFDSEYYTGTIEVSDRTVHLNIYDKNNDELYLDDSINLYRYPYPDLKNFLGTYKYYRSETDIVTITVYLDEKRCPMAKIEDGEDSVEFEFNPPYTTFFTIDYDGEMKLFITDESIFYGPDDDYEPYVKGDCGNKYLIIDNSEEASRILYKCLEPHYLN